MILVTGASGFIGGRLVEHLVAEGHKVAALTRTTSDIRPLKELGVEIRAGDLSTPESLKQATRGVEKVFHLAAYYTFYGKKELYNKINVEGTRALVEASLLNGVDHFIYCSSTEAIGPVKNPPASEDVELNPQYEYGRSKVAAEKAVKDAGVRGLGYTIIRPSGVYGPGNIDDVSYWFITAIASGGLASKFIIGSGRNLIQFVHIDDVVQGFTLAAEKPATSKGRTYNISDNRAYSYKEVYGIIADVLGKKPPTLHCPTFFAKVFAFKIETANRLLGREDFMWHTSMVDSVTSDRAYSIERAVKELGYKPRYSLRDGLKETVAWYREKGVF
jgi:dihydroflavonol-4-reductase